MGLADIIITIKDSELCQFLGRIPGGPGLINEILLSRLQAGMFSTVRLHCA